MKEFLKIASFSFLLILLLVGNSSATIYTYEYEDTWVNWPGYTSTISSDEHGTPTIDKMRVTINDTGTSKYLTKVEILLYPENTRQLFDSLFISTGDEWDSWDYFVHDGGSSRTSDSTGTVPTTNGLYTVDNPYNYNYTLTTTNRKNNPNGLDADSITFDVSMQASQSNPYVICYDFSFYNYVGLELTGNEEFFVAYAPWCDNDIIGGGTAPVPEPTTIFLSGLGLLGIGVYLRRRHSNMA